MSPFFFKKLGFVLNQLKPYDGPKAESLTSTTISVPNFLFSRKILGDKKFEFCQIDMRRKL